MRQMWQSKLPKAAVHIESLDGICQATAGSEAGVLMVVSEIADPACQAEEENHGQDYVAVHDESVSKVSEFTTSELLPAGGNVRKYVTAWPVKKKCSPSEKCPVVMSLHGHGEHTSPDLLQAWGYLNYLHHDKRCRAALGSLMVFPQLFEEESWVKDGPECLEHFVLPLLDQLDKTTSAIDLNRVALVGYSEGAVGAAQGALLYPDVFAVVASGSPVLPAEKWDNVQMATRQISGARKLRLAVVSFGENDPMGDMPLSLSHAVDMLTDMNANGGILQIRLHARLNHIDAYEALFNNWGMLYQVLWLGDYSALAA